MELHEEVVAIEYDRLLIKERNKQLAILLDIGHYLTSSIKLPALLDGVLSLVLHHFHFDAGRIYLMDETGARLNLIACQGIEPDGLESVMLGEGFSGKAAQTRSFLIRHVTDLEDRSRVELLLGKGYEMIACVPLISRDAVMGVMNLATERVMELDPYKIDLLLIVGNQIAHAANNAHLYEAIQEKVRELEEKKETIKFFAYSASHDLKSPAIGLNGLVERFCSKYADTLDEKGRDYCKKILDASQHILALTHKINAYIQSKEAPLHIQRISIRGVIESVRNEFSDVLAQRQIKWRVRVAVPEISADRTAMIRVLQNCVDNALKYGGKGLTEICIECRQGKDCHILSVSDNGIGMKAEEAGKVFELFQRHETSKGTEGAGLGMAIVREIVERHQGEVWVETAEGKGTKVVFSIPRGLSTTNTLKGARGQRTERATD